MPFYEYRCMKCGRRLRMFFSYEEYDAATPSCEHCGSRRLQRRIGRVAVAKSEDARLDAMVDETELAGLDEDDPKALGQFMRKMSHDMGEDMGDEFDEVVGRLESGESADSIEESMPELADEGGAFGGVDDF